MPSSSLPISILGSRAAKAVVVVAFVAVGGAAGAQMGVFDGLSDRDASGTLDQVPDGVDSVTALDASVVEDNASERLYAAAYEASLGPNASDDGDGGSEATATPADGDSDEDRPGTATDAFGEPDRPAPASSADALPANLTAALDSVENESGLDPRAVEEVVFFNQQRENYTQPQYTGAVVHADWSESAVLAAVTANDEREYVNTTVDGVTVYKPAEDEADADNGTSFGAPDPEEWIAALDDGEFAFGTERAVNDTIQVAVGDADPVDGDLESAYEETRDGYVRYAQRSQDVNVTQINRTVGGQTGLNVTAYAEAYNDLDVTAGSYYVTDDELGTESRILTNSTETAQDVADMTQGFISIQAGAIQNETLEDELRSANVTRDGTTVTVTRETSVDTATNLVRWYASLLTGSTASAGVEPAAVA